MFLKEKPGDISVIIAALGFMGIVHILAGFALVMGTDFLNAIAASFFDTYLSITGVVLGIVWMLFGLVTLIVAWGVHEKDTWSKAGSIIISLLAIVSLNPVALLLGLLVLLLIAMRSYKNQPYW